MEVAGALSGEIISADSMQIYRGMDIGTAKIKQHEMISAQGIRIKHHLIDILEPNASFSVAQFQKNARKLIKVINGKGRIPFLVGGTGLYVQGVIDPYNFLAEDQDSHLRNKLYQLARRWGQEYIYQKLAAIDPLTAKKIHPNDVRRVVRSLEIYYHTGKPPSKIKQEGSKKTPYKLAMIGLNLERDILYEKINRRVDQMIAAGLINEVEDLIKKGYSTNLNSMQGLGYRQIAAYLTGVLTKEEAIRLLKRDTRHFAKRQLTWFKRDSRINWFNPMDYPEKNICISEIIACISRTIKNSVE